MEPKKKINPRQKRAPVKPRPKLNARITDEHKAKRVPACPENHGDMTFNPELLAWTCSVPWCGKQVRPVIEKGSEFIILGEGQLELFIVNNTPAVGQKASAQPEQYLLRAPDNNVMLDITPYVSVASIQSNTRAFGHSQPVAEVTIVLQKITKA